MKHWVVEKISDREYHVIERWHVGDPDWILAKCTGPVPAGDIAAAMRLAQSLDQFSGSVRSNLRLMQEEIEIFIKRQNDVKRPVGGN